MKIFKVIIILFAILFASCNKNDQVLKLKEGTYRGVIEASDNNEIAFVFKVKSTGSLEIYNAEEVITVNDITYEKDSVNIQLPVFQTILRAKINNDGTLKGFYSKIETKIQVPFFSSIDSIRYQTSKKPVSNVTGKWEVIFGHKDEDKKSIAKGIFKQSGNQVTGTFRTTTGDYRFLEGVLDGNQLKLSTFDGAHAFLFTASVSDSTMNGMFYSRNNYKETFVAKRNEQFELPDAEMLTYLKEGYSKLEFSFPDINGKTISLSDQQFENKVVIVQIMGTWCPNCLDETRFFANYYKSNREKPIEFVALAFEYAPNETSALKAINRLINNVGVEYSVLLAQYGSASKEKAQEKLPMLQHILSYPTTIFIDKQGNVRKIHTGFNGPATGDKYEDFKAEFDSFVTMLSEE